MPNYNAPLDEIRFLLYQCLDVEKILEMCSSGIGADVVDAILEEAAKFAKNELAPLNQVGDKEGCKFNDGEVKTPTGFKEAYRKFVASGWNSVPFSLEYGGQGLPWLVAIAISEMWNGANMAFGLCPLLTQGAVESLTHHGSTEQKDKYLAKLISGEWTGTMCLTEPQAGSDLAAIRTTAVKNGDHYLIKGQKIFITYGEHDFADNIIHMVLARLPSAPEGVKGISLFIVPKLLEGLGTGGLGLGKEMPSPITHHPTPNDLKAISIEHKLGIHASPTAIMSFGDNGGAIGYLVGEENNGLKYMFTMMNNARLSVGVEGLGISESSYQQALAYANERVQGKSVGIRNLGLGGENLSNPTIISHPDVYRMLLTIKAQTEASRAIIYSVASAMDYARHHTDDKTRQINQDIVDLLTPIAKAHATELGFANSSLAMQVFGGVGYIEETGIAQNLRDSRIAMIYEGTNGIQAMDLVFRKLNLYDGRLFKSFVDVYINEQNIEPFNSLITATAKMQELVKENPKQAGILASLYLRMFGIALGAMLLNRQLEIAKETKNINPDYLSSKIESVEFYNKFLLPEINYIAGIIMDS